MGFLFSNNARTTLAAPLSPSDTTVQLATGTGAIFPNPTGGDVFGLSLVDAATGLITEITYCTARTGDNCTVERAQEGTAALSWSVGDVAASFVTAAMMEAIGGVSEGYVQQQPGNYAVDSGTANAMVIALDPAVTSYASIAGAAIRVLKSGAANTATCTININGQGPVDVILPGGANVPAGGLPGFAILELSYNAHYHFFQLLSVTAGGAPTGPAGGVLSGNYPNPGFANAPPDTVLANTTGATGTPNWAPYASLGWSSSGAGSVTVPSSGSSPGTQGSHGWLVQPDGEIINWTYLQLEDFNADTGSTWDFDMPFAMAGYQFECMGVCGLQGLSTEFAGRGVVNVVNATDSGIELVLRNTDTTGTKSAYFLRVKGK